ncbi:YndJ-like protein [Melghiribacillus thermohalophilus]|uniref:YndJ-like protein n=1 Tax=Melghiribacillus thermohalophilus TaxID=1324956 RepID=A0A4R3MW33_9BACI|nr:YndJ family transporter [Melghiribacillus thermohalophilus]TCT19957.1 YndJ-like protein [Melghiribacillus thermohalophilus]
MKKYLSAASLIGLVLTTFFYINHSLTLVESLLYVSMTVYLPLHFILSGDNHKVFRLILLAYPPGVLAAYLALVSSRMAIIWLIFCVFLAAYGVFRFFTRGGYYVEETLIDVSYIYMGIGGLWYVVYMMDGELFGFSGLVALLTAIHFHYSSLYVPLFTGLFGRIIKNERTLPAWYQWMSAMIMISPILIAAGITYSRIAEVISVSLFVLALLVYGIMSLIIKNWLINLSSLLLIFSMVMAFLYAIRVVDIPFMIDAHGLVNAIGFVGLGMIG